MFNLFTKNSQPIFGANFLLDKLIQVYYKVILSIHLIFFTKQKVMIWLLGEMTKAYQLWQYVKKNGKKLNLNVKN